MTQGKIISARYQWLLVSALLAVAVIATYAPVAGFDFINLDDAEYVRGNRNINSGFSLIGIKWAFENPVAGNWHPLTMLSHMIDCQIFGLDAGGHHVANVLLHLANTLLLFWALLAMTNQNADETETSAGRPPSRIARTPSNLWPCALVAALFSLHPLHVESVAWVSERKDVLSAFFFMLTLGAYSNYVANRKNQNSSFQSSAQPHATAPAAGWRAPFPQVLSRTVSLRSGQWYALALGFFALGLMSKPMLVTAPFVLLLLDYWPLRRISDFKKPQAFHLILEKVPFLLLAIVFSVITYIVQKKAGAVVTVEHLPLKARLASAMVSYAHYLGKTFWPDSLVMLYPLRAWTIGQIAGSTALFICLSVVATWAARYRRYIFVGWFLFTGMLVPVIGLVQVGQTAMADHNTYLPLVGIFIALAWGLADFAVSPVRRAMAGSGAVLAVALLMTATITQVRYWKDSDTLFEHALRVSDNNPVAHYILGALRDSQGNTEQARAHFIAAIRYNPAHVKARCALGHILCDEGKYDEAAQEYETALRFEPDSAKAHFGLAEVLMKQRNFDEAMNHYFRSLQSNPNIAEAHYQLAALFSARHDMPSTISHLQEALRLDPDLVLALNNLAWILATQPDPRFRNGSEAVRLAERVAILTGRNNPSTLDTLAAAYAEAGQFKDAVDTAQNAIQNANTSGQTNLAGEIESRLKLYQSGRAYRE